MLIDQKAPSKNILIVDPITNEEARVESNGALAVNIQDQTSLALDFYFTKDQNITTLTTNAAMNTNTLTLSDTTGFISGTYVKFFSSTGDFYLGSQVGAPSGSVIFLDTPINTNYVNGTVIIGSTKDMSVDGSDTTQAFQIGPLPEVANIQLDLTRVLGYIEDATSMDDGMFGGVDALDYGVVLRRYNITTGIYENKWNAKTNGDLSLICATDFFYTAKPPGGTTYGARFRNSYSGKEKHGVVIRLNVGDILEVLIQDDLTDLTNFNMAAQGHVVTD